MMAKNSDKLLRLSLIISVALVVIVGGIYGALTFFRPGPAPELPQPVLATPTAVAEVVIATPTALAIPTRLSSPTSTATPTELPPTPTPELPPGGIVFALTSDVNSVGWVQSGEEGNHFGESFLYAGLRNGVLHHGAMQFDLSFIPTGSTIFSAELQLTGLADEGLVPGSVFSVNVLTSTIDGDWSRQGYNAIHEAVVDETLNPAFEAADLGPDRVNTIVFNAAQRSIIEQRLGSNKISFRVDGLNTEEASWFGWDSGFGEQTHGRGPVLQLGVLPPVATETVAELAEAGTPTPTPTFVVITDTPTPENLQTAAAVAPKLTLEATTTGTPTPFPENWVTPLVVTETPAPENTATALFMQAEATAAIIAFGTSTPIPMNMYTATPSPTATATPLFILLQGELPPTETPTPGAPPTVQFIQPDLMGKIAFKSNRTGQEQYYVINPDGSGLALLTNCWAYSLAEEADVYSADGRYRVFTKDTVRYTKTEEKGPDGDITNVTTTIEDVPTIFWYDAFYKAEGQMSKFGAGIAYGGVWSPTAEQIAIISTESQNDEIWVTNLDGSGLLQLTRDEYAWWDKHPSWSPDGKQIVFWSNRTGHGQIFVMNADGSNLYSLSRTGFDDYDPVWIKYPGIPSFNPDSEDGKPNYVGSFGSCTGAPELNCSVFETQTQAQALYNAAGGPLLDPYGLDLDRDGLACGSMATSCSAFATQAQAQAAYSSGGSLSLDGDGDGLACEGLP